ncbi:MAG: CinA family protein [Candidatus Omnitrophota bacterium]
MDSLISQIHKILLETDKTVAVAESCTGGLLSSLLTNLSGSSHYFKLGAVVYSNESKTNILKIPARLISGKGAVSKEVAVLLAKNIRKAAKTDIGIGITGIAGPTGGTAKKPVGTVYIAVAGAGVTACVKNIFKGSRGSIQKQSAVKALRLLYENIHRH